MDKFNFLQIIQNPDTLNLSMRDDLLDIAENYPYFQGVYALISKLEANQSNTNQAAIRTANRNVLKDFLEVNPKKKDKRELIESIDLHTEQVNAFEKFENLEEEQIELVDEIQSEETPEFEAESSVLEENFEEEIKSEEEPIKLVVEEDLEEIAESTQINELEEEVIEKSSNDKLEENDLPVFDEPDYLKEDTEIDTQVKQADTAKDLPEYKENPNKGSFFDNISDDEFPEVNFEESEFGFRKTKSFFEEVEENDSQNQNNIEVKSEEVIQTPTSNTPQNETIVKEKVLHYGDYHLAEGEILPPDIKITAEEIQRNPQKAQYEDYHLTAPEQEAKLVKTEKIVENKSNKQNSPPKEEEKDKPTGSFFDSF